MVVRTAQEIIYAGAGCPTVRDPAGNPLANLELGECAYCGAPAVHRVRECVSANFVVCKQLRLGAEGLCRACAFCLRDLRLRCAPWIATPERVRFCLDRWGILDFLLSPPEPPFVAGVPWFGIGKGGLANWRYCRVWHPAREQQEMCPAKVDEKTGEVLRAPQILPRLQSKHTAIFARTAASRERYPLAIDDNGIVEIDVALWRSLAARLTVSLRYLPVPCLEEWRAPEGGAQWEYGIIHWRELTAPFEPHRHAQWWPLLLAIVPRPERPEVEPRKTRNEPPARSVAPQALGQLALF